jgi:hypothetical protein
VTKTLRDGTGLARTARRIGHGLLALAALGAATTYYFHVFRFSTDLPFTRGLGDWIDPYYVNVVLENWYYSVVNLNGSTTPPMYFPDVAARYSHGFILYAPIYTAIRLFAHPFVANTLTVAVVMIGGSWCLYLLFRRLGLAAIEAFVLSACFYTSPNVVNSGIVVWAQRASVFMIPAILLVLLAAIRRVEHRPRVGIVLGAVAGLLIGLFLSQDFYTAALVGLLGGLIASTFALRQPRASLAWVRARLTEIATLSKDVSRASQPSLFWLAAACVLGIAALWFTFFPVERFYIAGQGFSVRDPRRAWNLALIPFSWYFGRWALLLLMVVVRRAPGSIARAVNELLDGWRPEHRRLAKAVAGGSFVGVLVFLWIYLGPYLDFPTFAREMIMEVLYRPSGLMSLLDNQLFSSVRPFEIALGLVLILWVFPRTVDRRTRVDGLWFLFVSALVILMPLRFGDFSPWMTFFSWLPGMSAIRDPKRMIIVYELALVLVAAVWLTRMPRWSLPRMAAVLLVAGITINEWHTMELPYQRETRVFDQWVRSPIQIDPSCRSFFMKGASDTYMARSGNMWSLYAIDAAFIAMEHSIPTMNGYSAWAPRDWALANPQDLPGYPGQVDEWIRKFHLQGTCELDIDARTMKPHVVRQ